VVTYSVCSQEPEETIVPVRATLAIGGMTMVEEPPPLAEGQLELGYLLPGMFMAQLRRDT
jgi:hypothetical protein